MTDLVSISNRCAACGEALAGDTHALEAERTPCPACGSAARYILGSGTSTMALVATADAKVIPYARLLLQEAEDFYTNEKFGIAVVIAHTACEVATERFISKALEVSSLPPEVKELIRPVNGSAYTITTKRVQNLFNALAGTTVQTQPFWGKLQQSIDRRNNMVHKGVKPSQLEAEQSLQTASQFIEFVFAL